MRLTLKIASILFLIALSCKGDQEIYINGETPLIIDHNCTRIDEIPTAFIDSAKQKLVIAYGHTSHGSQLISGMENLDQFMVSNGYNEGTFRFNSNGNANALTLHDSPFSGAYDLGNPDRSEWAKATRKYLNSHSEVNVIMWSWCGQASSASENEIDLYLTLMNALEEEFPNVRFVYMTGHLDGSGEEGQLNNNNNQIRTFCSNNNKILYDFADIESFAPSGSTNYMKLYANDNCDYTSSGGEERNWAIEWQNSHTQGKDWYYCDAAHSQPINGNLKAFAAWWMFARLAGWNPDEGSVKTPQLSLYKKASYAWIHNQLCFTFDVNEKILSAEFFDINGKKIVKQAGNAFGNILNIDFAGKNVGKLVLYHIKTSQNNYNGKIHLLK